MANTILKFEFRKSNSKSRLLTIILKQKEKANKCKMWVRKDKNNEKNLSRQFNVMNNRWSKKRTEKNQRNKWRRPLSTQPNGLKKELTLKKLPWNFRSLKVTEFSKRRGSEIRTALGFSKVTLEANGKWSNSYKILKKNDCHSRIRPHQESWEGRIKKLSVHHSRSPKYTLHPLMYQEVTAGYALATE